jgi:DNA ligase (NAD+)
MKTRMVHHEDCGLCHTSPCTCPLDEPQSAFNAGRELIARLNQTLIDARHAYYALSEPIMPDSEYDQKEQDLKAMVEQMPEHSKLASVLYTVGSDLVQEGRIRHRTPMLSLENKYTLDELREWAEQFPLGTQFVIEAKVDGASCSAIYLDRKLVKAVTRGDGQYGEDVTKQMAQSGAIPIELPKDFPSTPVEIRGEVYITQGQFEKINVQQETAGLKTYANPRNLASGTMKLQDQPDVVKQRGLKFYPWQVEGLTDSCLEARMLIPRFAHHGTAFASKTISIFPEVDLTICSTPDKLIEAVDGPIKRVREVVWHKGKGMGTDGVVIKLVDRDLRKQLGVGTKYPAWAVAFKWPEENKGTVLLDVIWQTGRTGNMTPVGLLEPINLSGAIVQRVNLNNLSFIQNLGITIGDEVSVKRGGEVIPVCTGLYKRGTDTKPITAPALCACGASVVEHINDTSGVISHYCENDFCSERLKARLAAIADRTSLEIDGLGPELATQLVDEGYVTNLGDLFNFGDDIHRGVGSKGEDKIYTKLSAMGLPAAQIIKMAESLERTKTRDWDRWIGALELPNIGRTLGKTIAMQCRLQSEDLPKLIDTLTATFTNEKIEGVGEVRKTEVLDFLKSEALRLEVEALYLVGVRPKPLIQAAPQGGAVPLAGYVICITGEFQEEREKLAAKLSSLGAQMKTGVSKKLTHLLCGEAAGRSKMTKAKELNLPLLHKDWLETVLEANGMQMEQGKFNVEWDDL